jgi:hypothetical protein
MQRKRLTIINRERPQLRAALGTNWARGQSVFESALDRMRPLACKVAERASLSVIYAWPAANSGIHHCQVALLLLHFAAAGSPLATNPLQRAYQQMPAFQVCPRPVVDVQTMRRAGDYVYGDAVAVKERA